MSKRNRGLKFTRLLDKYYKARDNLTHAYMNYNICKGNFNKWKNTTVKNKNFSQSFDIEKRLRQEHLIQSSETEKMIIKKFRKESAESCKLAKQEIKERYKEVDKIRNDIGYYLIHPTF